MASVGDFEQQLMVNSDLYELPNHCEDDEWAHLYDLDLDIDFSDPTWYHHIDESFDFELIFTTEYYDPSGIKWSCDEYEWCWRHDEAADKYCDNYGDCYEFDQAILEYFEEGGEVWYPTENWNHGADFNW
jgi:hypothetical protein